MRSAASRAACTVLPGRPWVIPTDGTFAPHRTHGFPMTIFWFLMAALVLGGLLASLWYQEIKRGIWFRNVRVPARAPIRAHGPLAKSAQYLLACEHGCWTRP